MVADSPSIVQARPVTASLAVIVRMTFCVAFAYPVLPLLDITMLDRVGAVKSNVTEPVSAVVSASPVFPAASV